MHERDEVFIDENGVVRRRDGAVPSMGDVLRARAAERAAAMKRVRVDGEWSCEGFLMVPLPGLPHDLGPWLDE